MGLLECKYLRLSKLILELKCREQNDLPNLTVWLRSAFVQCQIVNSQLVFCTDPPLFSNP